MRSAQRVAWHSAGASTSRWLASCTQGSQYTDAQIEAWAASLFQWALLVRDPMVPKGSFRLPG
eukprot:5274326-Pyramimonas_sp.AAC.1